MAQRVLDIGCKSYTGLDLSKDTLLAAKENLKSFENLLLEQGDILSYEPTTRYDVVFSVLTILHIKDKKAVVEKLINMLKDDGLLVLSLDGNQGAYVDFGKYKVTNYPNDIPYILSVIKASGCHSLVEEPLYDGDELVATVLKCQKNKDV